MIEPKVYTALEVDFGPDAVSEAPVPRKVLICPPQYFDIVDVKNKHMEAFVGQTNKEKAKAQWEALRTVYRELAKSGVLGSVLEIEPQPGLEDMVFCANQSFPWIMEDGSKVVISGQMKHATRQREVAYFREFYERLGYRSLSLQTEGVFEGMGDTIPHCGKRLLYGGYGHRTEIGVYEAVVRLLQVPVIVLELVDERFYHLDTCFMPVDEETVFICREAFRQRDVDMIKRLFKTVIEVPFREAAGTFALNAHCINDPVSGKKIAVIQRGNAFTCKMLEENGYAIIPVDTSEFIQSGGSVFCMKMMVY